MNTESNEMIIASLEDRIAKLEVENARLADLAKVQRLKVQGFRYKYTQTLTKNGNKEQPFTPTAVDIIRKYVWRHMNARKRSDIVAALISQGLTKSTVQTRVSRIYAGIDESCHNEAIRERLGLDVE
jgi:hypothetical protein